MCTIIGDEDDSSYTPQGKPVPSKPVERLSESVRTPEAWIDMVFISCKACKKSSCDDNCSSRLI